MNERQVGLRLDGIKVAAIKPEKKEPQPSLQPEHPDGLPLDRATEQDLPSAVLDYFAG